MWQTKDVNYLLHHVPAVLDKQSDKILRTKLKIGFSQFRILMVLEDSRGIQQKAIAKALGQTEASVSRQIQMLLKARYLKVQVNPGNRRQHFTSLTEKGRHLSQKAREILSRHHLPMFEGLSEKEVKDILEILAKMHTYVCRVGKAGACEYPIG